MLRKTFVLRALSLAALVSGAPVPVVHTEHVAPRPAARRGQADESRGVLTVDSIMRGPKLVGYPPADLRWSGDSRELYFEWRRPGEDDPATYVVSRDGGAWRRLSDEKRRNAPGPDAVWDSGRRRAVFVDDGDIVVVDSVARSRHQVTRTTATESNPRWVRNDTHVTFTRDNNLFIVPLATGPVEQLTDVHPRKEESKETESQKFLKDEEAKLIEHTREQIAKKKRAEGKKERFALPPFELGPRQSVPDLLLSPTGEHVLMLVAERTDGAKTADVPNYVTESAYTETIAARTKVGDAQERRRVAILNLKTRTATWVDESFGGGEPATPAGSESQKRQRPQAGADTQNEDPGRARAEDGQGAARELRWSMPIASTNPAYAVAAARSADNKDRWIVAIDFDTGRSRPLDAWHDDAWVRDGGMGWMPDDRSIWFLSERDGWMHLYSVDGAGQSPTPRQLTQGRFELSSVSVAPGKQKFYFTSNEVHPGERHFYSMALTGGVRTRLTTMTGSNVAQVSPDESMLGVVYSYSNKPPEVYLLPNRPGAPATQITTSPAEEWRQFKWADPQLITFKTRDGADVYARLYTPEQMGARRDPAAPGVVFVHGAGYLQNAHKYWSTNYYREYLFHNLLASRGYVVLDADYRASAGYGRDWRTAIYRHMGGKDLDDVVDGAKYLVEKQRVHPRRIGVYGGSYGGFITLMAMFASPDTFAAGAALRPVTDWAHYNHPYTANILNEPQRDAEAYRRSSPIYFAEGLKGALLICHGMVDTNVHFQDSVRLAQRLIELRKENWELAVYPVENHAFENETSWADEYKRILKLFEQHLRGRAGTD